MDYLQFLGFMAGICTTISFLPQVITIYKTKSVADISLVMFVVLLIGVCLWIIYGVYMESIPITLFNGITAILVGLILYFKLKYK